MRNKDAAFEIIRQVSMPQAVAMYTQYKPKNHRIPCPIHMGENYNLSYNNEVFYCFVCQDKGNVIQFVAHIFNISYQDAIKKINEDFKLNLPIDRKETVKESYEIAKRRRNHIEAIRKRQELEQALNDKYNKLLDKYAKYDKAIRELEPSPFDNEIEPLYLEAVQNISYIEYMMDETENEIWAVRANNEG